MSKKESAHAKNNGGRPSKLSAEEKKNIINRYLIANGQDTSLLTRYGVYSQLAFFAWTLDSKYKDLKGYHFSDPETKAYIAQLTAELSAEQKRVLVGCAYVAPDYAHINQLAVQGKYNELLAYLRAREQSLHAMYDSAAQAMAYFDALCTKYESAQETLTEKEKTLSALREKVAQLSENVAAANHNLRTSQGKNKDLLRTIRDDENQIAVLTSNGITKGLGINDSISALIVREKDAFKEDHLEQSKSVRKIISLYPDLDDED